jgi:hypothetical protein
MPAQLRRSRCAIPKRNLRPAFIHAHRPGLVQKIETITAPAPLLGRFHQSTFYRVPMHIPELLHTLLRRPYVEVVGARLPECSALRLVPKQVALARVPPFAFGQQSAGRALLQHLHHGRGSPNFWFRQEQVNMFRHNHIPDDYEPVTLAGLFQNREEGIAAARRAQKRQSPVARGSDKVQVMSAVGPMQAAGHNKPHGTGSIVPALAKNARTGHPLFRNGKGNTESRATRRP